MEQFIALYDQYYYVLGLALAIVQIILIIEVVLVHSRLSRLKVTYERLFRNSQGTSLERVLDSHISRVDGGLRQVDQLGRDVRLLAETLRTTIRHVGLVRFNPFSDTGSDQSFAIALLDDLDNGVVISALHNRAYTRVYAKPIEKGQAVYPLSDEEKEAMESARKSQS